VDDEALATALAVARSAGRLSDWRPGDWPDLAVELLLAGFDDLEIAELAGLPASVTGWETDPLVDSLYERHGVPLPDPEEAVTLLARLMATDLRLRPATVTAPMIRIVAGLAWRPPSPTLRIGATGAPSIWTATACPPTPGLRPSLRTSRR
jgi:hypothetical protein